MQTVNRVTLSGKIIALLPDAGTDVERLVIGASYSPDSPILHHVVSIWGPVPGLDGFRPRLTPGALVSVEAHLRPRAGGGSLVVLDRIEALTDAAPEPGVSGLTRL